MNQMTLNDLLAQETRHHLAAFFARLREQGPLVYVADYGTMNGTTEGAWIVTNYDDALALLKDPRFTKDVRKILPQENAEHSPQESLFLAISSNMLMADPPDHTRLRGLVSKAFTPRMIEQLRPRIQEITDELLDAVQDRGQMDLITSFAYPLPITVISQMLGIPEADRQQFRTWTQAMVNPDELSDLEARTSMLETFLRYIQTLLSEKRAHPGNDLTSGLVQGEESGDQLSEHELISMIFLLIVAGHETTVNLIGNGTLALLEHPDQMRLLQSDPSLIPSAIEELLRYTAPVSLSDERWASEDVTLHGQFIRKGEMVYAALIAANTDPQQFADAGTLDITRQEHQHLAFGKGIHFCLGAPLARLEGQIAIGTLLRRLPNLRLAGDPEQLTWNRNPMLRGLTSLPVAF
jgi:cytochrome P450